MKFQLITNAICNFFCFSFHHNTSQSSIVEPKNDHTNRNRAQYTDLDAIDNEDKATPNENVPTNLASGSRSVQGWCNLRSAVAYYCSLRKIRRDGFNIPLHCILFHIYYIYI